MGDLIYSEMGNTELKFILLLTIIVKLFEKSPYFIFASSKLNLLLKNSEFNFCMTIKHEYFILVILLIISFFQLNWHGERNTSLVQILSTKNIHCIFCHYSCRVRKIAKCFLGTS